MVLEIVNAMYIEMVRRVTGRLLTDDQIRTISSHAVGKYLTEFLPETEDEKTASEKVEAARHHITEASSIITEMKG